MAPNFIDHLVFRVAEVERTQRFYTVLLGSPSFSTEDSLMYMAGDTRIFFTASVGPQAAGFEKENIGLNHLAFGVRSLEELQVIEEQLDRAAISHSGIKLDPYGLKEYLWLDDPDGMRIEFYLRSQ